MTEEIGLILIILVQSAILYTFVKNRAVASEQEPEESEKIGRRPVKVKNKGIFQKKSKAKAYIPSKDVDAQMGGKIVDMFD